ncbi:MAG TPA: CocE/NonD family hydrolase [Rhizomicrobium sp.]
MSPREIREHGIAIPLSDGRVLAARLWRPVDSGRWPAILDSSPYRAGDLFRPLVDGQLPWFAAQGYAVLAIDIAGSGNSTGILRDEYDVTEIDDLVAAIAWAARQDWCDGGVGLSGLSWSAFAALRAAARKPTALKAMVLGGVSEDGWRTDIHYLGGALYTAQVDWAGVMLMFNALPSDPNQFDGDWRAAWRQRLEANEPWIVPWLTHASHDEYWTDKAAPMDGAVPLLLYSGWADKYATSVLRIASAWRGPVRTVIGPWDHAPPDSAARGPRIGFLEEALRWWDWFLKGEDRGVLDEAPLRLWLAAPDAAGDLADGEWIGSALEPNALAAFAVQGNALIHDGEPDGEAIMLAASPANPSAPCGDLYEDVPASFDWKRAQELGAFVAQSAPFGADCDIGPGSVLRCKTSVSPGILVARLLDIAPDGSAIRMTTGALNRGMQAGEEIAIPFQAAAWRLKAGHRLGLVISSGGWPTFWPTHAGAAMISALRLTVPLAAQIDGKSAPVFDAPVSAATIRPEKLKWIDPASEHLPPAAPDCISLSGISAAHHLAATGTDYFIASRFDVATVGQSDARAAKYYRVAFERPGWSIRIDTALDVVSTPDAFHIIWRIEAREGPELVHSVARSASVPRTIV